jgi:hypothetical protein
MKVFNYKRVMAVICGAAMVVAMMQPSSAYQFFKNQAGTPYKWNVDALPNGTIYWNVDPAAPAIVRESMLACTRAWTHATDGKLKFAEGFGGISVEWDAAGTKIPDTLFLAYAYFSANTTQTITSAKIVINAKNYTWHRGGYTGVGAMVNGLRDANIDSVMLHELGHTLGMDHADRNISAIVGSVTAADLPTMNSVIYPGAESLHLDDETGARELYLGTTNPAENTLQVLASPIKGKAPLNVSFAQFGGDNDSQWDFGDGVTMRGAAAARKFTTPGIYNVEVVCNGKKGTVTVEVEGKTKTKKSRKSRNK